MTNKIVNVLAKNDEFGQHRVGLVTYADAATKRIHCDEHSTSSSMNTAINTLQRIDGKLTNTQDGLEKGDELLRERGCGERNQPHHKILVLISDGKANRGKDLNGPNATAAAIRAKGISIIAIGVGDVTFAELVGISGDAQNAFLAHEIDDVLVSSVLTQFKRSICGNSEPDISTTTSTTTTVGTLCSCDVDAHLLKVSHFTKYEIIREYNGKNINY